MQQKIVILPCNGDCASGLITWLAAQELVLEGKAIWYSTQTESVGATVPLNGATGTLILVDGCERNCLFNAFLERGAAGEHQLTLSEVGIEPLYIKDIAREDIQLAKDAIIAECTEVDTSQPPRLPGCCCG